MAQGTKRKRVTTTTVTPRKKARRTPAKRTFKSYTVPTGTGKLNFNKPYKFSAKQSTGVNPALNGVLRTLGGGVGNFLIPGAGAAAGDMMANSAHHLFKKITGWGDYEVDSNTLIKGDDVPQFTNAGRITRVQHREYIQDIKTSDVAGEFKIEEFPLNPAVKKTCPWLWEVAKRYEEYRIRGMIFEYKTMSSDALNSTNTALGSVIMATQYNVLAPAFVNKQQMENYEFGSSTKPSCNLIHPIECDPHETPVGELFVRTENQIITGSDRRLYDFGNFYIATVGGQAPSVNIGELWVSYDIELIKPKLRSDEFASAQFSIQPIDNSIFRGATKTAGDLAVDLENNSLVFPTSFSGRVMVIIVIAGTGNCSPYSLSYYNGTSRDDTYGDGNLGYPNNTGYFEQNFCVSVKNGGVVTLDSGDVPSNVNRANVWVFQIL